MLLDLNFGATSRQRPFLRGVAQTCPGDSRRTICATLAYLDSFSVSSRLRLLQRFESMRLPSHTFARRRLTVTPFTGMSFKFKYKSRTSTMYSICCYLLGLPRSTNSRRINYMETNFNVYRDDLSSLWYLWLAGKLVIFGD